jgi:5,5'-dehydrodivanillate O-demethylase
LLSEEKNELLCQTGPGTPMGELLRRYWHPIAGESDLRSGQPREVADDMRRVWAERGGLG